VIPCFISALHKHYPLQAHHAPIQSEASQWVRYGWPDGRAVSVLSAQSKAAEELTI